MYTHEAKVLCSTYKQKNNRQLLGATMLSSEIEGRYLRPVSLKDRLESSWNDNQHVWVSRDGGFVKATIIERREKEIVVEFHDHTVIHNPR